jgi:hypothetical protein
MKTAIRCSTAVVFVLAAHAAGGQDPAAVRIPDEVACRSCRIMLATITTLGDTDGPGALASVPLGVRVDGRGRYWVWSRDNGGGPLVYDATGRFLRVTGRRGQGPGEFEQVADVLVVPGDSVFVVDQSRRATMFGPDLSASRHQLTGTSLGKSVVVEWPDTVIAFSEYASGERGGPVLHVIAFDSASSRVVRSFGPTWNIRDIRSMEASQRVLAPSRSGVWSATFDHYRLEHWTADGFNDVLLLRIPPWPVRTAASFGDLERNIPPPNSVRAIMEDSDGHLWVFINVASPSWRDGWPRARGEFRASAFSYERLYRTLVEVIDPKAGRVLVRHQLNEWVATTLPGGRAAIYSVDANDIPRLRIVQLRFEGKP